MATINGGAASNALHGAAHEARGGSFRQCRAVQLAVSLAISMGVACISRCAATATEAIAAPSTTDARRSFRRLLPAGWLGVHPKKIYLAVRHSATACRKPLSEV